MQNSVMILGVGSYFPPNIADNAVIAELVGKSNPWGRRPEKIGSVFGTSKRYFQTLFTEDGYPIAQVDEVDLAVHAATKALASANCGTGDVALLVYISGTAPASLSKSASRLHNALSLSKSTGFMQLSEACAGFASAVGVAVALMQGNYNGCAKADKKVLLVTTNGASGLANRKLYAEVDAVSSLIVFGDGAGAFVLGVEESHSPSGFLGFVEHVDSDQNHKLIDLVAGKEHLYGPFASKIEGTNVMKFYVPEMAQVIRCLYDVCPVAREAKFFLLHQPRESLTLDLAQELRIDKNQVPLIVRETGNIGSVFIPTLFSRLVEEGKVATGDIVVAAAIGDGNKVSAFCYRV